MDTKILGKNFWVNGIKGKVHSINGWTETHGNTTHTAFGPDVNIKTYQYQKFWISSSSGRELEVHSKASVANNHEVICLFGNLINENTGNLFYVKNISSGQEFIYVEKFPKTLIFQSFFKLTIIYWVVIFYLATHYTPYNGYEFFAWILVFVGLIHLIIKINKNWKAIKSFIKQIASDENFINSLK